MSENDTIINCICTQLDFNLAFAKKLVEDLTPNQMTAVPGIGFENHPAFTLGHLVSAMSLMVIDNFKDSRKPGFMPEGWRELFLRRGPGDPRMPEQDITKYPSKEELLTELERKHTMFKEKLNNMSEDELMKEDEWRFKNYFPTFIELSLFMSANHEAMHLGQLSAWRRAMGLDSALAKV